MSSFFLWVLFIGIAFLPIVLWGYVFSYLEGGKVSRDRFVLGIVAGLVGAVPLLFFDNFLSLSGFQILNIFQSAHIIHSFSSLFSFGISLSLFFLLLVGSIFIFLSWMTKSQKNMRIYFKNIIFFLLAIGVLIGSIALLSFLPFNSIVPESFDISFGNIVFESFSLVFLYYTLIAFIEEASKYFSFLEYKTFSLSSKPKAVLAAIFVSLGFVFLENILYFFHHYQQLGFQQGFLELYISRGVFSLMLHVLCSSLISYGLFSIYSSGQESFPPLRGIGISLAFLAMGIGFHMVFDVALTLGLSFMVLLYFVGSYFYISSIFYKE